MKSYRMTIRIRPGGWYRVAIIDDCMVTGVLQDMEDFCKANVGEPEQWRVYRSVFCFDFSKFADAVLFKMKFG